MRPLDVYWHIYRKEQIKPELRGPLFYLLEIPIAPGFPVLRHVFDPVGRDFPKSPRQKLRALLPGRRHGIFYEGVSKAAVYDVTLLDPKILKEDRHFLIYNRILVCNSRQFFLLEPNQGLEGLPPHTARLLSGKLVSVEYVVSGPRHGSAATKGAS